MPRLWAETIDAHRRDVRHAILDTAARLVEERGLRGVTMSRIAEQTGIGRATLYKYFSSVEAILRDWHRRQIAGHLDQLAAVRDAPGTPLERLEAVLRTYALLSRGSRMHHDAEWAAFLHREPEVRGAERTVRELLRGLLQEAADAGEIRTDVSPAELAGYCVHALSAARTMHSKVAVDRLVGLTLDGLRPSGARAR